MTINVYDMASLLYTNSVLYIILLQNYVFDHVAYL